MQKSKWMGVVSVGTIMLILSALLYIPQTVSVSNSVDGRELPIYCVETDKKQVALSFDAAWGAYIMCN